MKQREKYVKKIKNRWGATASYIFFAICLFLFEGKTVSAAPARLLSASAAVYETADENSNAVGNLVQGNTFELRESITTENGEQWYLITMSNGIQGYMKGEISQETGNPDPAPGEEPEAEAPGGAEGEDGEAEGQEDPEAEGDPEEAQGEEAQFAGMAGGMQISDNTQDKTYSIKADAERIRTHEAQTKAEGVRTDSARTTQGSPMQNLKAGVDKALILLFSATILSALLLYGSYKRLKRQLFASYRHTGSGRRKKTKRSKKKKTAKEAKKWKNNNLQK